MTKEKSLSVSSAAFRHEGKIPIEFTCEGAGTNPPLDIEDIPAGTKSLALIMDDPDAPKGTFVHWVVWNIRPQPKIIANSDPGETGKNSLGENRYTGPCPPSGTHRYFFKVYALDTRLTLGTNADKKKLEEAVSGHVLAYGELMGMYSRGERVRA